MSRIILTVSRKYGSIYYRRVVQAVCSVRLHNDTFITYLLYRGTALRQRQSLHTLSSPITFKPKRPETVPPTFI